MLRTALFAFIIGVAAAFCWQWISSAHSVRNYKEEGSNHPFFLESSERQQLERSNGRFGDSGIGALQLALYYRYCEINPTLEETWLQRASALGNQDAKLLLQLNASSKQ